MSGVTWLHLSDWHQKADSGNPDRDLVVSKLIEDIRQRANIDSRLRNVDFVVFSGDVAYSGTAQEYAMTEEQLLKPLQLVLKLSSDALFFVPGNHDLERARIPVSLLTRLTSEQSAAEWLQTKLGIVQAPFEEFIKFVRRYNPEQGSAAYASHLSIGVKRRIGAARRSIALLGLNSAWMSARNRTKTGEIDDKGCLVVGLRQLMDVLEASTDSYLKIAVMHHPFEWLEAWDKQVVETRLRRDCHFILRGHEYGSEVDWVCGTQGDCVVIPAGAIYNHGANQDYPDSYNFVHLDFESGQGVVYLRRWSGKRQFRWISDDEAGPPDGAIDFEIPSKKPTGDPSDLRRREVGTSEARNKELLNAILNDPEPPKSKRQESLFLRQHVSDRSTRTLKVFLCHSKEDKPAVRTLYKRLLSEGVDPWLDEEKLLAGQEWELEIQRAVKQSDAVIVCLSATSVTKTGYIQKEIRYALDIADEQLEGAIFVIPLKLEKCEVPDRLRRWQWLNFFEEGSYERLMLALRTRANSIGIQL